MMTKPNEMVRDISRECQISEPIAKQWVIAAILAESMGIELAQII